MRRLGALSIVSALLTTSLLVSCSSEDSDDGDDKGGLGNSLPEEADDDQPTLELSPGSSLILPGAGDDGLITEETPFEVAFDSMTCDTTHQDAAFSDDYTTKVDLIADEGNQICIVELEATNQSTGPATFSTKNNGNLRTTDGLEFSTTDKSWDDQGWLHEKDREPSYTADNVQPGETKYDVVAYELPDDLEPESIVYTIYTAG